MGRHQIYRGNPTQKQYYLVNNFSGGINTVSIDDAMGDYEYRELINVELEKQGIIQNRKGFGEINIISNLLEIFDVSLPTGNYNLFKVLSNTEVILENIIEEKNYTYQWVAGTSDYWNDNGEVGGDYDVEAPATLDTPSDIGLAGRVLDGTYTYYKSTYSFSGTLKILTIVDNCVYLLEYDGTTFSKTQIQINGKDLPSVVSYKDNLTGINCVDFSNKLYMSLNDISEYFKGILVYDKDDDTWTTWRGQYLLNDVWTDLDSDLLEDVYKPVPYDISTSDANVTQGFNVLAEEPLLYIDDQKTGLKTVRNIILTDISDGSYLDKIPTSGDFILNVIKTGSGEFKPENLQIFFRDENNNYLDYKIGTASSGITAGVYGTDNGGYFSYTITDLDISSASYVLIDIFYKEDIIVWNEAGRQDIFNDVDFLGITSGTYVIVDDEDFVYIKKSGVTGRIESDYTQQEIYYTSFTDDLSTFDPATEWSSYETSSYTDYVFKAYNSSNEWSIWIWNGSAWEQKVDTLEPYDTKWSFIPRNGTYIKTDWDFYDTGSSIWETNTYYFMFTGLTTDKTRYSEVSQFGFSVDETIVALEGQFFEIGDADIEEPIEGLDLENVKLIVIDDKLIYYNGNTIYFSNSYQFSYIPNFAYLLLTISSNDEITDIHYFRGSYLIFTKYTIWKMTGTYGDDGWTVQAINYSVGCIAPKSVKSIENTLYFMSEDGLYRVKQNYYTDGLENVTKMDKNIPELLSKDYDTEAIYWNEQYILYFKDYDYDAARMYVDIDLSNNQHPFVTDKFTVYPDNVFKESWYLLSPKNGKLYSYNNGYTDFMLEDSDEDDYTYTCTIKSCGINFGYTTHDKKFKNLYIKTIADSPTYLYLTIWLDGYLRVVPYSYKVTLNENEEIVYEQYIDLTKDNNLNLNLAELANFELGDDVLGDNENATHKVVLSSKGKTLQLQIEQKSNGSFGVTSIGYLYKLGKVREQR